MTEEEVTHEEGGREALSGADSRGGIEGCPEIDQMKKKSDSKKRE